MQTRKRQKFFAPLNNKNKQKRDSNSPYLSILYENSGKIDCFNCDFLSFLVFNWMFN